MNNILRTAWLAILGFFLTACTSPYKTPEYASRPPNQTEFQGLFELLNDSPEQKLDVLLVHGMCTHGYNWARDSILSLNKKLGGPEELYIIPRAVEGSKAILFQANLSVSGGEVRVSALVWSPIVEPLKHQLCYDQTIKSETCNDAEDHYRSEYPYKRALLNRTFKDTLLDDCLADAIIYQGRSRDEISKQIQKAILMAASSTDTKDKSHDFVRTATNETRPLAIITESLGSKITFDAIYRLANCEKSDLRAAGLNTFARTTLVFMGANQLPILALGDQTLAGTAVPIPGQCDYPPNPLNELIKMTLTKRFDLDIAPPRVVAFTDPNDLLSYILVPSKEFVDYEVVDVIVSNANTWFGLFENPLNAHTDYLENDNVSDLIVCGRPAVDDCLR